MTATRTEPETRSAKRVACAMRAIVYAAGRPFSCTVVDLSVLGCRLEMVSSSSVRMVGDGTVLVELSEHGLVLYGEIMWRRARCMGIQFDHKRRVSLSVAAVRNRRGRVAT